VAAIAAPYTVVGPFSSTSTVLYTAPTTSGYYRDVIVTNGGPGTVQVNSVTAASSTTGTFISPGSSLVLLGPVESLWGMTSASTITTSIYVGQLSQVSVS
jgi:hypothetical protein